MQQVENIPETVRRVSNFCEQKRMMLILSRNKAAGSCLDASLKRSRAGRMGIPLFDELKTGVEYYFDKNGDKVIIATHCRGNQKIERKLLKAHIENNMGAGSVKIHRLETEELQRNLGMEFGTVNPILIELQSKGKVYQFFDESILRRLGPEPGTMMTNAGNHTWGMEFFPDQLIGAITHKAVFRFAYEPCEEEKNEDNIAFKKYGTQGTFDPCQSEKPIPALSGGRGLNSYRRCGLRAQACGSL